MMNYRSGFLKRTAFVIVLLAVVLTAPIAWAQPIRKLTINYIEASAVPEKFSNQVRAYVTVSDIDEKPILGLSESEFEALEDGRMIEVDEVSQTTDPMAIVLAIDTSGSMQAHDGSGFTSMAAARDAAVDFISMLSDNDQVALYSFNNETFLEMDFSLDHAAVIEAVKSLAAKPNAATRLYDTALASVKKAAEIPKGRRAVILLTDGRDEKAGRQYSSYSSSDVIDAATTKTIRVPIYTIGVGPQVDARELARMAGLTGGRSLLAKSLEELPGFYQIIASQLKNQYLLTYTTRAPSGEHSLVIKAVYEGQKAQDEKRFWSPPLPVARPPQVRIVGPRSSDLKRGTVMVRVSIVPEETVAKVRYYVDGALEQEYSMAPFDSFKWDTTGLSKGLHIIRVEAVDVNGQLGSDEMTTKMPAPAPAPKIAGKTPTKPLPKAVVEKKQKGISPFIFTVGALLLLLVIVISGLLWWMALRRRKAELEASPLEEAVRPVTEREPMRDIEDETQYMPDFGATDAIIAGKSEPVPIATLTVIKSMNLDPGKTFEVIIGTTTIGRTSNNDIFIPDKPVSRKHAAISYDGSSFHIHDLGSKNGTIVDDEDVSSGRTALSDGARIQLSSKTILEFNVIAPEEEEVGDDDITKISDDDLGDDDATKVY